MQIRQRILKNDLLCKFGPFCLQHSKTFDISHAFLRITIAELSTLKQVQFFWPTLYNNLNLCWSQIKALKWITISCKSEKRSKIFDCQYITQKTFYCLHISKTYFLCVFMRAACGSDVVV